MLTFLNAVVIVTEMCVFLGLRSGIAEGSIFVGCDAASLDNRIPYLSRERRVFIFKGRNVLEEYFDDSAP